MKVDIEIVESSLSYNTNQEPLKARLTHDGVYIGSIFFTETSRSAGIGFYTKHDKMIFHLPEDNIGDIKKYPEVY